MSTLVSLLAEFYRDKLEALLRHQRNAAGVSQYDCNNTYQYIIGREEVQLSWLAKAIEDGGGTMPPSSGAAADATKDRGTPAERVIAEGDAREAQAFVDRWKPRVDAMTHARHRGMLRVILGETLEQKRFFEQAAAGRLDLLGQRSDQTGPRIGHVLSTRWIE